MANKLGVKLELVGLDGNALSLLGAFSKAAKRQGFDQNDVDAVITEATRGDYNHLLCTLMDNTVTEDEEAEDFDEDEEDQLNYFD